MAVEFVRPAGAGPWLEKTRSVAVLGREALTPPVRSVGKTPLPISPSRPRFALDELCQAVRAGEVNTTAYRSSLSSSRRALSLRTSASASCRAAASQLSSASALSSLATASRRAQDIGKVLKQGEPVRVSRPHGGRTHASAQSPIEADRKLINLAGYQTGTSEREIPSGNCQPKR